MPTCVLSLPAEEIVALLRAEMRAALGQPQLAITILQEHIIEEDFDRTAYRLRNSRRFDLITALAVLEIEPRLEGDYWILSVTVEQLLGPRPSDEENDLVRKDLTLDEFEAKLRAADAEDITVRLSYELLAGRQHFDAWLGDLRHRHPAAARAAAGYRPSSRAPSSRALDRQSGRWRTNSRR